MAVPAKPKPSRRPQEPAPRAATRKVTLPYTGKEFLESLDDGREVWIYGERVKNDHRAPGLPQLRPHAGAALRRAARRPRATASTCSPSPPGRAASRTGISGRPTTVEEQVAGRDAIAAWARITYGWLGRSPDYKAAFLGTLGANAEFYAPVPGERPALVPATPWSECRSSTTRSSIRRSTATWRPARPAGRPTSTRTSPRRRTPASTCRAPRSSPPARR